MSTEAKATLNEMWDVAEVLAHEMECSQGALVLCGMRSEPHRETMRRVEVLRQICLLIERIRSNESEVRAILMRK